MQGVREAGTVWIRGPGAGKCIAEFQEQKVPGGVYVGVRACAHTCMCAKPEVPQA